MKIQIKQALLEGHSAQEITEAVIDDIDYNKFKKKYNLNYKINDINKFDKTINDLPEDSKFRESFLKAKEYRNNQNNVNQNNVNLDSQKKENLRKILKNEAKNKVMSHISSRFNPIKHAHINNIDNAVFGGVLGGTLGYIGDALNDENSDNPLLDKDSNLDGSLNGMGMGAVISPIAFAARDVNSNRNWVESKLKRDYKNIRKYGKK